MKKQTKKLTVKTTSEKAVIKKAVIRDPQTHRVIHPK